MSVMSFPLILYLPTQNYPKKELPFIVNVRPTIRFWGRMQMHYVPSPLIRSILFFEHVVVTHCPITRCPTLSRLSTSLSILGSVELELPFIVKHVQPSGFGSLALLQ